MMKNSEVFDRETSLGWLVVVLHQRMSSALDKKLADYGLSIGVWPALMCLWEEDNVTQVEISRKAQVQNSTTTRVLDRLEAQGLVERRLDNDSRRSHRVCLTESGRLLKDEVLKLPVAVNEAVMEPLTVEQRQQLIDILRTLVLFPTAK